MKKYKYFFGSDFRSIPYLTTIKNSEESITVVTTEPVRSGRGKKLVINPVEKLLVDKNVTVIAITIPKIPKKLPCLDVSGEDKPLKARINNTPETK